MPTDQQTALSLIEALRFSQKGFLARLNQEASIARKAGNHVVADQLSRLAIALSQQNLTLHRARQKVLLATNLTVINQRLMAVVTEANQISADIDNVAALLKRAAEAVSLLRRLIDVFI